MLNKKMLIESIRNKSFDYIQIKTLETLNFFLSGFDFFAVKNTEEKDNSFCANKFQKFIEKKYFKLYNFSSGHNWQSIISFFSHSENQALQDFFICLDEFYGNKKYYYNQNIKIKNDIFDTRMWIVDIKKKPAAYLGKKSLKRLYYSILGFNYYRTENTDLKDNFLNEFQLFIDNKYKLNSDKNWAEKISFFSTSEENEFRNFCVLYDEYELNYAEK